MWLWAANPRDGRAKGQRVSSESSITTHQHASIHNIPTRKRSLLAHVQHKDRGFPPSSSRGDERAPPRAHRHGRFRDERVADPLGGKGSGSETVRNPTSPGCVAGVWTVADTQNTHTRAVSETGVICLPSQRKKFTPAHTPPPTTSLVAGRRQAKYMRYTEV